jgi:hypothetical protein
MWLMVDGCGRKKHKRKKGAKRKPAVALFMLNSSTSTFFALNTHTTTHNSQHTQYTTQHREVL